MIKVQLNKAIIYNKNEHKEKDIIDIDSKFYNEFRFKNVFKKIDDEQKEEENLIENDDKKDNTVIIKKAQKRVK